METNAIVGRDYVVYGTISYISFSNYEKGSDDLETLLSGVDPMVKAYAEAHYTGKMSYYLSLSGGPSMTYMEYNFVPKMLRINRGDEVAFVVTCEDGYIPGRYDYVIKRRISKISV